jgi:hypothetical protein
MMRGLREWKHLALLVALVVAAIAEPLSIDWSENARISGTVTCRRDQAGMRRATSRRAE